MNIKNFTGYIALTVLVSALIGSSTLSTAPAAATTSPEPAPSARDIGPTSVTTALSCTNGRFQGEAVVSTSLEFVNGQANWTTTIDRYRITRSSGQSGGNKANVDLDFAVRGPIGEDMKTASADSADAMRQDGAWHDLGLRKTMTNAPLEHPYPLYPLSAAIDVSFTFDKSGNDPRCRTWRTSAWGPAVKGVWKSPGAFKRDDEISSCTVQTSGATCSITKTDTKTSTVSASASVKVAWLTGQLSASWTSARAIAVSCSSPPLTPGQRWAAFPSGTSYTFSTYSRFFGTEALVAPGHAFEVDGGVGCEASGTPYCAATSTVPVIRSAEYTRTGTRITGCGEPGAQVKTTNDPSLGWFPIESGAVYVSRDGSFDVTTTRRIDQQAAVRMFGSIEAESNHVTPRATLATATRNPTGGLDISGHAEPGSEIKTTNDPNIGWFSIEGGPVRAGPDGSFRASTTRLVDGWAVIQSFGRHQSVSNRLIPTN